MLKTKFHKIEFPGFQGDLNIETNNGKIYINGELQDVEQGITKVVIFVDGDVTGNISSVAGHITAEKVLGNIVTTSGNITVQGDVGDSVGTVSGDVTVLQGVKGNVKTVSGDITH